ncbi:MAG: GDSL-type esterase/lipase family protein [Crocinitomicaceae bacterium]
MRLFASLLFLFIFSNGALFAQEEGFEFVNPPMTIVVLGSSTAAGAGTWPIDRAWVNRYRKYVQGYNPDNQVINLAKGGYNTYHLLPSGNKPPRGRHNPDTLRNITEALTYSPDGIVINLPSNDISGGFSVKEQLDNFRRYASICEANNVELWVTTTQPRNFPKTRKRQLQAAVKDSLWKLFPDNCIDFWTEFTDENLNVVKSYDSGDGCHLNNEGHRILTDRVIRSHAFKKQLIESSFQRNTLVKYEEELSPNMMNIGFSGGVEFNAKHIDDTRYIKIVQYGRILNAVEVENSKYDISTIIDLRYDVKVEFESQNGLKKVVHLDFKPLMNEDHLKEVFYPLEILDFVEMPIEKFNYRFDGSSITVASFKWDTTKRMLKLDKDYVQLQKLRIEDAMIFPPTEGKKMTTYWENGNKKSIHKFKNGQLHCKSKWFAEDGTKQRFVSFKNGMYNGKLVEFEKGKKKRVRTFKDDQLIKTIEKK